MKINSSTILPGGWHYKDAFGYRIPHSGELPSPNEVVNHLMTYRLENNIAVGDPEGDLESYVCEKFPQWCRRGDTFVPMPNNIPGRRNVDLIIGWANALYVNVGRLNLVPQKEAEERAAICSRCPMQMEWAADCPPCVTSAQRLLSILRQGKDSALGQAGLVKGCSAHGWDNRTACHIDKVHLPTEANPNAPSECWMRKK